MYLNYKERRFSSQRVHTDCGYRETLTGISRPERVAEQSSHLSPKLRTRGAKTPVHLML